MRLLAVSVSTLVLAFAGCSSAGQSADGAISGDGSGAGADVHPAVAAADAAPDLGGPACRAGNPCYSDGFGACINMGTVSCSGGAATCSAPPPGKPDDSFHASAASNGSWDWNCNNNIDRKYPLAACESFTAATCPALGWSPKPGQTGDSGQDLVQRACSASGSGCVSTGAEQVVTEGCK
jgi:hypothetical protein